MDDLRQANMQDVQASGSRLGSAGAASIQPPPPPCGAIADAAERFDQLTDMVRNCASRAEAIADRTFGGIPVADNASTGTGPMPGTIGTIHFVGDALDREVQRLQSALDRLATV